MSGSGSGDRSRCLWASCGPDPGRSAACARRGPGSARARIAHREPLPFDGCSRRSRLCNLNPRGPAGSGCVSLWSAVCGRLADGIWLGDYRISWASCGPSRDLWQAARQELALTESENSPGACAMRFAHIPAESVLSLSASHRLPVALITAVRYCSPSQASPGISVAEVIVDWSRGAGTAGSTACRGLFRRGRIDDDLRHADAEFHPLLQRNCFDGSVVHVGDPAHDREAEARAG